MFILLFFTIFLAVIILSSTDIFYLKIYIVTIERKILKFNLFKKIICPNENFQRIRGANFKFKKPRGFADLNSSILLNLKIYSVY